MRNLVLVFLTTRILQKLFLQLDLIIKKLYLYKGSKKLVPNTPPLLFTKMPERKTAYGLRYTRKFESNIRTITRELVHYKAAPDEYKDEFDNLPVEQLHGLLTEWRGNLSLGGNLNRFFRRNGYSRNGNGDHIDETI